MSQLLEQYNRINSVIEDFYRNISEAESKRENMSNYRNNELSVRISNLEEQLDKIDEYMLKVEGFRQIAEKNIDSMNALTIEAPEGYRVNLNRLRNWAMKIDPMSENDPYAQRVYVVTKCDEVFLNRKKEEFLSRIKELKEELETASVAELNCLTTEIDKLNDELKAYCMDKEVTEFAKDVETENNRLRIMQVPDTFNSGTGTSDIIPVGAVGMSIRFHDECKENIKTDAGVFYDDKGDCIYIPFDGISMEKEFAVTVSCIPSRKRLLEMDSGIRNLLFNVIDKSYPGSRKVYIIDAERQNSSVAGPLKKIEGTFAMAYIPRNSEQITEALENIVSSFADIDEILENYDSVEEYNKTVDIQKRIERKTVVLVGWPKSFKGKDAELVTRIITNYERYGISFIAVSIKNDVDKEDFGLSEYLNEAVIHINMSSSGTSIAQGEQFKQKFAWYTFKEDLSDSYVESLESRKIESSELGNEYTGRFDLNEEILYTRGNKSLSLPVGVDSKDAVHNISFDNENFAAYLMGASGSGKSTLLHTLITGIIRGYHPDDVELWLADFKMAEFAQYINPMPPHVKYILLDESQELVYDLIDKLTEKMIERQRFFMRHKEIKKVEDLPSDVYMPIIFVLFDEFSIMSQAVAESEQYKLKLQNLLAKGRALGIKFLFSSQSFTKGIAGLTSTAKDQIQSRIAMKNSKEEISETLQLSSRLKTEQVRNWLDVLPPHYALYKYRNGDSLEIKRLHVLYFDGKDGESYGAQRELINRVNRQMHSVEYEEYSSGDANAYVDKQPVVVDGNSYDAFDGDMLLNEIGELRKNSNDMAGDEIFLTLGSPRLMVKQKLIELLPESRENLLLIGSSTESMCCASVITSIMNSFLLQGKDVEIWTYERDKIYRTYEKNAWNQFKVLKSIDDLCEAIYNLKSDLQNKNMHNDKIIVMLGFESICAELELLGKRKWTDESKTAEAEVHEEQPEADDRDKQLLDAIAMEISSEETDDEFVDEDDDIEELLQSTRSLLKDVSNLSVKTEARSSGNEKAYNAIEDLQYIVSRGGRQGIHFLLKLNSYGDLKHTGIRMDWFKHRLAFQISADDSKMIFGTKVANTIPEHVCEYTNSIENFSFRPYLHADIAWDGWELDDNGKAINIFNKSEEVL